MEISCKYIENYPLKKHTTYKIGGNAEIAFFPKDEKEFSQAVKYAKSNEMNATVIGGGSNLLISSQGVKGAVIITTEMNGYEFLSDNSVKAFCGMKSPVLAKILQEKGLSGLEFLIGIPGTIGGAVAMNSSALKQSIKDTLIEAEVFDLGAEEIKVFSKEQLKLNYRTSALTDSNLVLLSAVFELVKSTPENVQQRMNENLLWRKEKHPPINEPNAGSIFRNPAEGVFAGELIEKAGLKRAVSGGAKISEKHANFIINSTNATSLDISRLMFKMYNEVNSKFGYKLKPEIKYIGIFSKEEEEIWKILNSN